MIVSYTPDHIIANIVLIVVKYYEEPHQRIHVFYIIDNHKTQEIKQLEEMIYLTDNIQADKIQSTRINKCRLNQQMQTQSTSKVVSTEFLSD